MPSFSLDKPAWAFSVAASKRKLSFEPELDFSIDAKPWQFLFWWRYKLLNTGKLKMGIGTHLALSFRDDSIASNGLVKNRHTVNRFWVGEVSPN